MLFLLCFLAFLFFFIGLVRSSLLSILGLVLGFIVAALAIFFMGAEFLSLTYVVVYVGSICMLFLFLIMMIDPRSFDTLARDFSRLASIVILFLFFFVSSFFFFYTEYKYFDDFYFAISYVDWIRVIYGSSNIVSFSEVLFNNYTFEILLVSACLLLGMLGPLAIFMKDDDQ